MASVADSHAGLARLAGRRPSDTRLGDLVSLLDHARDLPAARYQVLGNVILRLFLAGDHEDPSADPELGEHSGRSW